MTREPQTRTGSHPADRLLDVNEVAALLGVKRSTVYQWSYERRLPVVGTGQVHRQGRAHKRRFAIAPAPGENVLAWPM